MNFDPLYVVPLAVVGALGAMGMLLRGNSRTAQRIEGRLRSLEGEGTADLLHDSGKKTSRFAQAPKAQDNSSYEQQRVQLQYRLMHAGIYWPYAPIAYVIMRGALLILPPLVGVLAGYLGYVPLKWGLVIGGLTGGICMFLPSVWLDRKKLRRQSRLNRSLPDAFDIMVTCVEAGLSLEAALLRVTEELRIAHPLLAGELSVVQRQIEFGASQDVALRNFAERTDLDSIFTLSSLVQYARRFGTGVGEALRTHAEMLRHQREQNAEELAQKAAVKVLFPTLLLIFPSIFVVVAGPAVIQLQETFAKQKQNTKVQASK